MPGYEDPDWPSRATAEGQTVRLASGLGGAGRKGKVIAWVWLLALVAFGLGTAILVLSGS